MSDPANKPRLRVGLVGAGWVTQHHLAGWQAIADRAEVVAIADPDLAQAQRRAEAFNIPHVFASAEAMFDDIALDAVDIASPRETHAPLVRLAAARGVAVMCQKPLAPTYDEAVRVVADVAGQTRLMVHENWRFRQYYRDLGAWLAAGRIGRVLQAQMTLYTSGLIPDDKGLLPALERQPFIGTLDRALVMEILIHHIDTLRYLLGDLTLQYARLGHASAAMRGEDRAAICFETTQGAPVLLMANLRVHGRAPAQSDRLTLIGEHGTIELEGMTLRCLGEQPATLQYDASTTYLGSYAAAIAHFVDALDRGTPFETHPEDNLQTLSLVEAIYARGSSATEHS
ncbi:Gfo/Idh/MocA family oxidoreductase [Alcaligenaceae bacterium B3P038]|nr:Gfo/Idh/MocA family oxidoreductase [Alcaligenaceae bacterium B3P038]